MVVNTYTLRGRTYVPAPRFAQRNDGLLALADVRDVPIGDPILRGLAFELESTASVADLDYTGATVNATADIAAFSDLTIQDGLTGFTVYAGAEFNALVAGEYDPIQRATERLLTGEETRVEKTLWDLFLGGHSTDITPTPGTAVKPIAALGLLAEYAGIHYNGLPTFHAGRRATTTLSANWVLERDQLGGHYVCSDGAPLIAGDGYYGTTSPDGTHAPTATQAYVYVTGTPLLYRSAIDVYRPPIQPSTNGDRTVAYREYVPVIEAFSAGILVDLT